MHPFDTQLTRVFDRKEVHFLYMQGIERTQIIKACEARKRDRLILDDIVIIDFGDGKSALIPGIGLRYCTVYCIIVVVVVGCCCCCCCCCSSSSSSSSSSSFCYYYYIFSPLTDEIEMIIMTISRTLVPVLSSNCFGKILDLTKIYRTATKPR